MNEPRWILQNDDDGHWYVIPADKKDKFQEWSCGGYEVEPQPEWALQVGGHPNNVTFSRPEIFGEPVA